MHIQLLYFEDCPSHAQALAYLQSTMDKLGINTEVEIIKVETSEQAQQWAFTGSPTIRVDGSDLFPEGQDQIGLGCRVYHTPNGIQGSPTKDMIHDALVRLSGSS